MIPWPWIKSLCCSNANMSRLPIAATEAWSDCLPDSSVLQARQDHTGGSELIGAGIDRSHVHKHIVFNSTSIDGTRKFKNFWLSSIALQKVSNRKTAFEDSISIIWSDHNSEITKKQVQSISVCTKKQIRDVVSELLSESGGLYIND